MVLFSVLCPPKGPPNPGGPPGRAPAATAAPPRPGGGPAVRRGRLHRCAWRRERSGGPGNPRHPSRDTPIRPRPRVLAAPAARAVRHLVPPLVLRPGGGRVQGLCL